MMPTKMICIGLTRDVAVAGLLFILKTQAGLLGT